MRPRRLRPNEQRTRPLPNRSKTVLVGWELGAGRGHLEHLAPIVAALIARGDRVVAAMRDVTLAREVFNVAHLEMMGDLTLRQAPIFVHRASVRAPAQSLAQIMADIGFADARLVGPVVQSWRTLVDEVQPDLIIADFAPSLICAARGRAGIIVIGNAWTVPPDAVPAPSLPLAHLDQAAALDAERRVVAALHEASRSTPPPDGLTGVLRGDRNFVFGHPWLDGYAQSRVDAFSWPPNMPAPAPSAARERRGITIYLPARHPAQAALVVAVASLGVEAEAYFGGERPDVPGNLAISTTPLPLADRLPCTSCFVHHGGLGAATWAITHGAPQVILPIDLEKHLIAWIVEGRGRGLSPDLGVPAITEAVRAAAALRPSSNVGFPASLADPRATIEAILRAADDLV